MNSLGNNYNQIENENKDTKVKQIKRKRNENKKERNDITIEENRKKRIENKKKKERNDVTIEENRKKRIENNKKKENKNRNEKSFETKRKIVKNVDEFDYFIDNNKVTIVDGFKIDRIKRIDSKCGFIVNTLPKIVKSFDLIQMNNYIEQLTSIKDCIVDFVIEKSNIKLYFDNYQSLFKIKNVLIDLKFCKRHDKLNCEICECQNIQIEKLSINRFILITKKDITENDISEFYKSNGINILNIKIVGNKDKSLIMNKIKYRVEVDYEYNVSKIMLQDIKPENTIIKFDGEISFFVKNWEIFNIVIPKNISLRNYIYCLLRWDNLKKDKDYPLIIDTIHNKKISIRNGNYDDILKAKKEIDNIISPIVIDFEPSRLLFIKNIESEILEEWKMNLNVIIEIDYNCNKIKIFGKEQDKTKVRNAIANYFSNGGLSYHLENINVNAQFKSCILKNIQNIQNYGITCYIYEFHIELEGAYLFVKQAQTFIDSLNSDSILNENVNDKTCCFCIDEIVLEKKLSCGCSYCTECFRQMILSFSRTEIEIVNCLGCNKAIQIKEIESQFNKNDFENLKKYALNKFISKNLDKYRFCPNNDCNNIMFYDGNDLWKCKDCNFVYCKNCRVDYYALNLVTYKNYDKLGLDAVNLNKFDRLIISHNGITCEKYKKCKKESKLILVKEEEVRLRNEEIRLRNEEIRLRNEKIQKTKEEEIRLRNEEIRLRNEEIQKTNENLYKEWLNKNTKKCPKCKTAIEKNNGCLHMNCRQCGTKFCWGCLSLRGTTNCTFSFCHLSCETYNF